MRKHRSYAVLTVSLAMLVLVIASPALYAVIARLDVSDQALLKLGSEFPATGKFNRNGGCTLIAPSWVITAAHVVRGVRAEAAHVTFEDQRYPVKRIIVHQDGASKHGQPPRVDLALVELAKPVTTVKPVPLYRKQDELGQTAYIAGFGDVRDGNNGLRRSDGVRRAVTNIINEVIPNRLHVKFEKPPAGTDTEGVGGPGDSGGPLYLKIEGKTYLAGVSHASMGGEPQDYDVVDMYMRVSQFAKWIDDSIGTSNAEQ